MHASDNVDLFYRLDAAYRIVEVGGAWDAVAERDDPRLMSSRIIDTALLSHIVDQRTRTFVKTAFDTARLLRKPRTIPYRCDTPTSRRWMEMTLLGDRRGLLVEHRLIRAEPMQLPLTVTYAGPRARISRCSNCNALRANGVWHEADEFLAETPSPCPVPVAYGFCDACKASLARGLAEAAVRVPRKPQRRPASPAPAAAALAGRDEPSGTPV